MKTLYAAVSLLLLPACCMAQSAGALPADRLLALIDGEGFTVLLSVFLFVGVAAFAATRSASLLLSLLGIVVFARVLLPFVAEMAQQSIPPRYALDEVQAPVADYAPNPTIIAVSKEGRPTVVVAQRAGSVVTAVPTVHVETIALPDEKSSGSSTMKTLILTGLGIMAAAAAAAAVFVGGGLAFSRGKPRTLYGSKVVNTGFTPRTVSSVRMAATAPTPTAVNSGFTPARP